MLLNEGRKVTVLPKEARKVTAHVGRTVSKWREKKVECKKFAFWIEICTPQFRSRVPKFIFDTMWCM